MTIPQPKNLLIRNARLVDPSTNVDAPHDLLFTQGFVAAIAPPNSLNTPDSEIADSEILDASGLVLAPGLIDIHVHLREPGQTWKETIATGTRAAAAGGFTTVCAMPNTVPVIDTPEWTRWLQQPERNAAIRLLPMAAATVGSLGHALTDYAALKKAGAVGVTDDGKPIGVTADGQPIGVTDGGDAIMRQALEAAARAGLPVSQHAEDTRMTAGASMNAGALAFRLGLRGMPVEAESSIIERDIALVRELTASLAPERLRPHLHVQHISTKKALDAVRAAKAEGLHITCEVMPHHFALNEHAVEGYNTHAKMNPPLRAESDRLAMLAGLFDGSIDCIATDHAPHAPFEKEQEFERAPNGITGLETALGLSLRILHAEQGMPLSRVLALLSVAPARLLSLKSSQGHPLGTLIPGSPADAILFDPAEAWTFHAAAALSRSKNSPFDGWQMQGRIHATIFAGNIVHRANHQ